MRIARAGHVENIGLTIRHVPALDHEPEQEEVHEEEGDAHHDQQRDVLRGRCGAVEQQVDQASGEREAEVDVELVRDCQRKAGEQGVHAVESTTPV